MDNEILTTKERIKLYKKIYNKVTELKQPTKNKIVNEISEERSYPETFVKDLIKNNILIKKDSKKYRGNQYTTYQLNKTKYRETLKNSDIYQDLSQIEAWDRKLLSQKTKRWLLKDEKK